MIAIICGGRTYSDWDTFEKVLNKLHERFDIEQVISGGAKGADMLAEKWCIKNGIFNIIVHANWQEHGRRAGPIRNAAMLRHHADTCIAFPGGIETSNMIEQATRADLQIITVDARGGYAYHESVEQLL